MGSVVVVFFFYFLKGARANNTANRRWSLTTLFPPPPLLSVALVLRSHPFFDRAASRIACRVSRVATAGWLASAYSLCLTLFETVRQVTKWQAWRFFLFFFLEFFSLPILRVDLCLIEKKKKRKVYINVCLSEIKLYLWILNWIFGSIVKTEIPFQEIILF